jgi:DNA-binding transcriptional ArsR family regulator
MVSQRTASLDRVFQALADPTRRSMLRRLAGEELNIRQLAEPLRMTFPAASKHVRVLESAGLVRRTVRGRSHFCRINAAPLAAVDEWLRFYQRLWTERLDALAELLEAEDAAARGAADKKKRTRS